MQQREPYPVQVTATGSQARSMKLDRFLVAVDFSDSSIAAVEWAVRHLAPDAEFILAHAQVTAAPPPFLRGVLPPHEESLAAAREDAAARLRRLAAALPTERVQVEVAAGRPAREIARAAERLGADLVLLGPHGADGRRRSGCDPVGSTAEELARCCAVPALIVRGGTDAPVRRIVASVDGSPMTQSVLEWAAFLSQRMAADLVLVHVVDPGLHGAARTVTSTDALEELQQTAERVTGEWLAAQAEEAGVDAARVTCHVAFGNPGYEIVTAAEEYDADLLIVGSRGADEVGPAALGGVAGAVLRGSRSSVLVVTHPAPAQ
jgi:nucleotide-binding universal stress UspA family protein